MGSHLGSVGKVDWGRSVGDSGDSLAEELRSEGELGLGGSSGKESGEDSLEERRS